MDVGGWDNDDDAGLAWGPSSASLGLRRSYWDSESEDEDMELLTAKATEACDIAGMSDALRAMYKLNLAASIIQGVWRSWREYKKEADAKAAAAQQARYSKNFGVWAEAQRRTWTLGPSWKPSSGSSTAFTKFEAMDWSDRSDCLMGAAHFFISRGLWSIGQKGIPSKKQLEELLKREAGWRSAVGGGSSGFSHYEYMSWAAEVQNLLTSETRPRWGMGGARELRGSEWEGHASEEAAVRAPAAIARAKTARFERDDKSKPLKRSATFNTQASTLAAHQPLSRQSSQKPPGGAAGAASAERQVGSGPRAPASRGRPADILADTARKDSSAVAAPGSPRSFATYRRLREKISPSESQSLELQASPTSTSPRPASSAVAPRSTTASKTEHGHLSSETVAGSPGSSPRTPKLVGDRHARWSGDRAAAAKVSGEIGSPLESFDRSDVSSEDSVLALTVQGRANIWPLLHSTNDSIGNGTFLRCGSLRATADHRAIEGRQPASAPASPTTSTGRGQSAPSPRPFTSSMSVRSFQRREKAEPTISTVRSKPTTAPGDRRRSAPLLNSKIHALLRPGPVALAQSGSPLSVKSMTPPSRSQHESAAVRSTYSPLSSPEIEASDCSLGPTEPLSTPIVIPTGGMSTNWHELAEARALQPADKTRHRAIQQKAATPSRTLRSANHTMHSPTARFEKRHDQGWQPIVQASTTDKLDRFVEQHLSSRPGHPSAASRLQTETRIGTPVTASPMRTRQPHPARDGVRSSQGGRRQIPWALKQKPPLALQGHHARSSYAWESPYKSGSHKS